MSNFYRFKTIANGKRISSGVSLYTACSAAIKNGEGDIITGGRLIAFYCQWRKCIAPGFGACDIDREALSDMFGEAPAL